mgnify:CR=1 FL=1
MEYRERQKCGSFFMEGKQMVKESGHQDYTEELKKLSDKNEKRSTPKSILEKLKELEKAMITVPVEETNE